MQIVVRTWYSVGLKSSLSIIIQSINCGNEHCKIDV